MDGWNRYVGKKVFLRLRTGRVYSGVISSIDESSKPLVFISLNDKFGHDITIVHSEIIEIKEED